MKRQGAKRGVGLLCNESIKQYKDSAYQQVAGGKPLSLSSGDVSLSVVIG